MAATATAEALRVQQWDDGFFTEFINRNRFKPYMGRSENSMIQVKENLTKGKGDRITINLVGRLKGDGRTNNQRLKGYEESLGQFGHRLTVNLHRHGVVITEMEEIKNAIDLRKASRVMLMKWRMELQKNKILDALGSVHSNGYTTYANASAAERNAWLVANSDRVLFGALLSNASSGVMATALGTIDTSADKCTPTLLSTMKRIAEEADPHITPINTAEDENFYVVFVGARVWRDLMADSTFQQAFREGLPRGKNNPLFRGGDLVWDGMIIRKIPEITSRNLLVGVGDSSDVEPVYLCGAQALGYAIAKRPFSRQDSDDYDNENGTAVGEIFAVEKLMFQEDGAATGIQHGVVTGFFSASADS